MNDACGQQIYDTLRSLKNVHRIFTGRKQTPTFLAALRFIGFLLSILDALYNTADIVVCIRLFCHCILLLKRWNPHCSSIEHQLPQNLPFRSSYSNSYECNPHVDIEESRDLAHEARLAGYVSYHSKPR